MSGAVILVSPAPIDGYPPVQYQARLLADAGFQVELITQPLSTAPAVKFQYPGVRVTALKPIPRGLSRHAHRVMLLKQFAQFIAAVTLVRLRRGPIRAEVAFDADGIFISDHALLRPRRRIAHLHETQQRMGESHLETRLRHALPRYGVVVVADDSRADLLRDQMGMAELPWVTPNYPLKETEVPGVMNPGPGFEVIYAGSLGPVQMIDLVIRSVALWPKEAHLTLIGDDTKPAAVELKALAASLGLEHRVRFIGWLDLDQVVGRYRQAQLAISLLTPELNDILRNVGASNKRYQFMQAGLAQIGDRIPALIEVIEGNGIGRCVTAYNEQAIADLVDYYVRHPEERLAAGRKAEQLHLDRYNYQAAFEPTLRWIREGDSA
jgi:glycosyltransferase involved in cell wall biosynthesis